MTWWFIEPSRLTGFAPDSLEPNKPLRQPNRTLFAIKNRAKKAPFALALSAAPSSLAGFNHPRANRQALLGGVPVAYELRRSKRRTIALSVSAQGLSVSAPTAALLRDIDKLLLEKSLWVIKKLQQTHDKHQQRESARIDWANGCSLPFLGKHARVVLEPQRSAGCELKNNLVLAHDAGAGGVNAAAIAAGAAASGATDAGGAALYVGLPYNASADQIRSTVQAWLMQQATRIFTERLNYFAPALNVRWSKLSLSSAATRWGSARSDGAIRLNWRLLHFSPAVIDYVVVHELSHLQVMNHSPQFWALVRATLPNYADARQQLKTQCVPNW